MVESQLFFSGAGGVQNRAKECKQYELHSSCGQEDNSNSMQLLQLDLYRDLFFTTCYAECLLNYFVSETDSVIVRLG